MKRFRSARGSLTKDQYYDLLKKQHYVCGICSVRPKTKLHVDHCHTSTVIRGLLCLQCNSLLGHAKDDVSILLRAIKYLRKKRISFPKLLPWRSYSEAMRDPEKIRKQIKTLKATLSSNPEIAKRKSLSLRRTYKDPEVKKRLSKSLKKAWKKRIKRKIEKVCTQCAKIFFGRELSKYCGSTCKYSFYRKGD